MPSTYTTQQLIDDIAGRTVPLEGCTACEFRPYAQGVLKPPPGFESDHNSARYRRVCASCKNRHPYGWVKTLSLEAVDKFLSEHQDAFAIDELKALLPKQPQPYATNGAGRQGWEFL